MSRFLAIALGAITVALNVAACGGSSSSGGSSTTGRAPSSSNTFTAAPSIELTFASAAGSSSVLVVADPSGRLTSSSSWLTAQAGKVTIKLTNMSPLPHNLTIQQGSSGQVLAATSTFQRGAKTVTLDLKPGTYTFSCGVPGHPAAGMQGTLWVR